MKGTAQFPMCGFSGRAIQILKACGVDDLKTVNVLEDEEIRQGIKDYANWPTIPQLYVNGEFVGGSDIMMEMYQCGELQQVLERKRPALEPCRIAPGRRHHRRHRRGLWRAAAAARTRAGRCETHLVVTPAGVLNAHHELGLDRTRARGAGRPALRAGRRRRLPGQRQLRHRGDGRRALLDEDAGRRRPRLRRQPADARRRRHAEGAPPPAADGARDAVQPGAPAQHDGRHRDGRHRLPAAAGVLPPARRASTRWSTTRVERVLALLGVHGAAPQR